jgi:ATP-dependent DNA helicase RecG
MNTSLNQLQLWMSSKEDEHLEFKQAKQNFHFEKLVKYCAALANEGGGKMILGVTDKIPRHVVGCQTFKPLERTKAGLIDRLRLRIEGEEINHPDGRVIIFHVPSRPIGMPIQIEGAYWMRGGEELVPMTPDMLKRIFDEGGPDFSAEFCPDASINDLILEAIDNFRKRWIKKSGNQDLEKFSVEKLLEDAELMTDGRLTYAALILFGTRKTLGRCLAQAEIIFEYRSTEATGPSQQREEFRQGFFSSYDALWDIVSLRNERQHFQDGLFMLDIPTFNEGAIREAILNAISHRDYRHAGSVIIRQFPRRIEIVSPGGFPPGITPENILDRQFPRNRRLADAFAKCGLVERAGQGLNRIFEACIREGKPLPDFQGTDEYQVSLTLHGQVQDPRFIRFLEKIGQQRLASFTTHDLIILNYVFWGYSLPDFYKSRIPILLENGIIERTTRNKYILSRQFHSFLGRRGTYTRKRGLDKETNKALLLKHFQECGQGGCKFEELAQVLPSLSRYQIHGLLKELKEEKRIKVEGRTKAGRWFAV